MITFISIFAAALLAQAVYSLALGVLFTLARADRYEDKLADKIAERVAAKVNANE